MLRNLLDTAPRTEPLIRIYPGYITFNAPAAKLLGFRKGDAVAIMQDDRDGYVYVANSNAKQSYTLTLRKNTFKVSNAPLCRKLADSLDGFGTYKICPEEKQVYMERTFYNIFKKRYGKVKENTAEGNIQSSLGQNDR